LPSISSPRSRAKTSWPNYKHWPTSPTKRQASDDTSEDGIRDAGDHEADDRYADADEDEEQAEGAYDDDNREEDEEDHAYEEVKEEAYDAETAKPGPDGGGPPDMTVVSK
jgi:hypothetical protein